MAIVQTASIFRLDPKWELHKNTFESYKLNGDQPGFYGRDASLSHPHVHHIHLAQTQELANLWAKKHPRIDQVYYRTTLMGDAEHDYWLVYAYDDLDEKYLLLMIVGPDAHNNKKWRSFLTSLYTDFVEPWINGKLDDVV